MTEAVVLCGGAGRRIGGRSKPYVPLAGRPLLEHVLGRLRAARPAGRPFSRILLAGDASAEGAFTVHDPPEYVGRGPLAGVLAGLEAAAAEWVFVCACDAPFPSPGLVAALHELVGGDVEAVVPKWRADAQARSKERVFVEPLFAWWRRDAAAAIRAALRRNERRVSALLRKMKVKWASESLLRTHDPRLLSFFNVNSPREMEEAESLWRGSATVR